MRRAAALAILLAAAAFVFAACAHRGRAPPPGPGDCAVIQVWSNGAHTSLALPGRIFGPTHPLRRVFPDERHFLVGYGARDYYLNRDPGAGAAIAAALPPTPAVLHVIAADAPPERSLWRPRTLTPVAVSEAGLARIAADIDAALTRGADGAPVRIAEGRVPGASAFLAARPGFHFFHMCNHWTAARLSNAGARLCPGLAFHAPWLTGALDRGAAPSACPAG